MLAIAINAWAIATYSASAQANAMPQQALGTLCHSNSVPPFLNVSHM